MKKSITKFTSKATVRKRPKSVLTKAWETRRARKAIRESQNALGAPALLNPERSQGLVGNAKTTPTSETETRRSEVDRVALIINNHRDEMLLGFMGDMSAMRSTNGRTGHHPIMLSKAQANAIEDFLTLHGYSAWGKGSGALMSVSTNPNAA